MTSTEPVRLCPECRDLRDRWVHTSPAIVRPGIRIAAKATYDDTPAGVRDNRANQIADWRDLVDRQIALIYDICAAQHRAPA